MIFALIVGFTALLFSIASAIYNLQLNKLFCKDLEIIEHRIRWLERRLDTKHNNELFLLISKLAELTPTKEGEK